ncbi:MAG: hypothetical protein ACKV2T_37885 [Kofleriaceae bacterium]
MTSSHDDERDEVRKLIAAGDDRAAFARLRSRLGWPAGKDLSPSELPTWIAMLGELATRRGAEHLATQVDDVVRDPDSPDRLYALGYSLIDADVPTIAATLLWHCLALVGDSEEVVCELVSALESALAYPDALAVLEERAALRQRSYLARYLYGYNAAMSGRLAITREVLPALAPESPDTTTMRDTLAGMIERADRVASSQPLDTVDLRGWHYVLTGGLLLHQSPYGFDEPMHGRYAWLSDSLARIAFGLGRLAMLVRPLALPCVYAPPGRANEIVAHAASRTLGIPIAEWPAVGVPAPGLVVVYDLAELPPAYVAQLVPRRAEQIFYAHATPWTYDSPVAPDVTTLLYQSLIPPWGEKPVVDPVGGTKHTPHDERPPAEIAANILASAMLDSEELASDQPERWASLVSCAWPPTPGPRSRMWAGGPVPSSRFA